jgi:hypothetical protein
MSKKMMLLAVAVATTLALSGPASAEELHITGITSFTGTGGATTLQATGEPTITSTAVSFTGSFDSSSSTTGKFTLDLTGSTAEFFGIKANCNTSGAASGTIAVGGTFHVIQISSAKPGILLTPGSFTVICPGFSNITFSGNVIGTITSPACGASSTKLTTVFKSSGSTQEHLEYTGVKHDLTAQTGSGSKVTAGLTSTLTLSSLTAGTINCTF